MLNPIPPEVLESNHLLDRALKQLGLVRSWRRRLSLRSKESGWVMLDDVNRPYRGIKNAADRYGTRAINNLDEFLEIKWFEHYHFEGFNFQSDPKSSNVIQNPFYDISREELAIRLDLLEA